MNRALSLGTALIGLLAAVAPAVARPQYCQQFFANYSLKANEGVFQGKACLVCHVDSANKAKGWNQYGKDFAVALGDVTNCQERERIITALKKIEEKSSSNTKATYLDSIKKAEFPAGSPQ